jgi:hypothetical protein
LELLKDILAMPQLSKFALVGGTNLSLRLGHRLSIDLDLFTSEPFDTERLANDMETSKNQNANSREKICGT